MTTRLATGEIAPAFSLPNFAGEQVTLSDYRDSKVILYFYPAAATPGCTREAVDFSDHLTELAQAGYQVLGVSPDPIAKLAAFREDSGLKITLLSDESLETLKAYGAYGIKKLYGREITGVIRSTFVIDVNPDGEGTIEKAQYNVKATGHVDRLIRDLGI